MSGRLDDDEKEDTSGRPAKAVVGSHRGRRGPRGGVPVDRRVDRPRPRPGPVVARRVAIVDSHEAREAHADVGGAELARQLLLLHAGRGRPEDGRRRPPP